MVFFRRFFWILMLGSLAACGSNPATLPTLADMPAAVAVSATETSAVSSRATLPATFTITPTESLTPTLTTTITPSVTPSATITDTPSPTVTDLPTVPPEERSITSLLLDALNATVLPTNFVVPGYQGTEATLNPAQLGTPSIVIVATDAGSTGIGIAPTPVIAPAGGATTCSFLPPGGFGSIFNNNPDIAASLGCPQGAPPDALSQMAIAQSFQQGTMIWLQNDIYVLKAGSASFRRYDDTYVDGTDPVTSPETPPSGLLTPVRGFLKIWSTYTDVRTDLAWAITPETSAQATTMLFARGMMLGLPGRPDILVFISSDGLVSGTWRSFAGQF